MHKKNLFSCVKLAIVLAAVVLIPSSLRAETAPVPIVGTDANALVRLEVIIASLASPPKQEKQKSSEEEGMPMQFNLPNDAVEKGIDKAIKMNADLSAKWPKCHFRIGSITAPEITPTTPIDFAFSRLKLLRVTFLGDSGCLSPAK